MDFFNLFHIVNLIVLLCVIVLDVITGLVKAFVKQSEKTKNGGFSSSIMRNRGIIKLTVLIIMLAVDGLFTYFQLEPIVITCYTYYYVTEGFSIIENLNAVGVPVPKVLVKFLEKTNAEITESEETKEDENDMY